MNQVNVDISPDWKGSTRQERRILKRVVGVEQTPKAIQIFARDCEKLGDYWYWFTLSTLWVSYSGHSDLNLWRQLFRSTRPNKRTSLMKPSECEVYLQLPEWVRVYRAHRVGEKDWISYTIDPQIAARFARERGVDEVVEYLVERAAILAVFTRRGEYEVMVLEPRYAQRLGVLKVVPKEAAE